MAGPFKDVPIECYLSSIDFSIHPDNFGLLGMKIGDDYNDDKALPIIS